MGGLVETSRRSTLQLRMRVTTRTFPTEIGIDSRQLLIAQSFGTFSDGVSPNAGAILALVKGQHEMRKFLTVQALDVTLPVHDRVGGLFDEVIPTHHYLKKAADCQEL